MVTQVNDPKMIAMMLREIAGNGGNAASVLSTAADMLDPPPSDVIPLFYVKGNAVFQRPVQHGKNVRMGFCVCEVMDGVDPAEVCAILNKGEPATE